MGEFPRKQISLSSFPAGGTPWPARPLPAAAPPPPPPPPWRLPPASRGRHRRAGWWRARPPNSTPENRLLVLPRRVRRRVFSPTVPGALAPQSRPRACGCGLPGAVLPSPAVGGSAPEPSWDVCWGRDPRPGSCCPQTTATSVPKPAGSWVSSGQSESVYTWWPVVTRRRPGPGPFELPRAPRLRPAVEALGPALAGRHCCPWSWSTCGRGWDGGRAWQAGGAGADARLCPGGESAPLCSARCHGAQAGLLPVLWDGAAGFVPSCARSRAVWAAYVQGDGEGGLSKEEKARGWQGSLGAQAWGRPARRLAPALPGCTQPGRHGRGRGAAGQALRRSRECARGPRLPAHGSLREPPLLIGSFCHLSPTLAD